MKIINSEDTKKIIEEKIKNLKGNAKKILEEYIETLNIYGSDWDKRSKAEYNLKQYLVQDKKTFDELLNSGLKDIFYNFFDKEIADLICESMELIFVSSYSDGYYRRPFRSSRIYFYKEKIFGFLKLIEYDFSDFSIYNYISNPENRLKNYHFDKIIPLMISAEINRNNKKVIDAIEDIMLADNNVLVLSREIIIAIAICNNDNLQKLLLDLLLAAKLQEGFRQMVFETADLGNIKYFIKIINLIIENNLIRFSSCKRGIGTWFGLGYDYNNERELKNILNLGRDYLVNKESRLEAVNSKNVLEIYCALWAEANYDIDDLFIYINKSMSGEKYQKLISLYFLNEVSTGDYNTKIAAEYIKNETDLDVIGYLLLNYKMNITFYGEKKELIANANNIDVLKDKKFRDETFNVMLNLLEIFPSNGINIKGKPFEWSNLSISRKKIFDIISVILLIENNDTKKLIEVLNIKNILSSTEKQTLFKILEYSRSLEEKEFLFFCLEDRNTDIKIKALKEIKTLGLKSEEEIIVVENLLRLKTGDVRTLVIEILSDLESTILLESVKRLLKDKLEGKRLGALDILAKMIGDKKISIEDSEEIISLMPTQTEREKNLLRNMLNTNKEIYNFENGFKLYNPDYKIDFENIVLPKKNYLQEFKKIKNERLKEIIFSLCKVIKQNEEYKFNIKKWDNSISEIIFGTNLYWLLIQHEKSEEEGFNKYVLSEVWEKWMNDINLSTVELVRIMYFDSSNYWRKNNYNEKINLIFNEKDLLELNDDIIDITVEEKKSEVYLNSSQYIKLAYDILGKISDTILKEEIKNTRRIIMYNIYESFEEKTWMEDFATNNEISNNKPPIKNNEDKKVLFIDTLNIFYFASTEFYSLENNAFINYFKMINKINYLSGTKSRFILEETVARGIRLNICPKDKLYDLFFYVNKNFYHSIMQIYSSGNFELIKKQKKDTKEKDLKLIVEVAEEVAQRIIDIEVNRGDRDTEVSRLANKISKVKGVDNFVKILVALGNETFVRGYLYYNTTTKKEVLSKLLKISAPNKNDRSEDLRKLLDNRISDARILEAAMYSPSWINIIEEYLGWNGLKSGIWYFHAHTSDSYSADQETEVARFSPISNEDFREGAFDIEWFKSAYKILGKEKFQLLYDSAKYISEGAKHRRAQLFADAALGKLKKNELEKEIIDKRNKDKLLAYSVIPLGKNKFNDALSRYDFIQKFLKQSKKFGAQRQASEGKVSEIALDNLARNLGFRDTIRFSWKMETLKIDSIQKYFEPTEIEGYTIYFDINKDGEGEIFVLNNGKRLKNIPSKLNKNNHIIDLKEIKKSLREQLSRAKFSFENAMINRDEFEFSEISDLSNHPVIKKIINKLVFRSENNFGFLSEEGLEDYSGKKIKLNENSILKVAHSYDLYENKNWIDYQKYIFNNKLVQPFKQVFRELYLINEDEKNEKTVSRRYAGHQIQTKKTLALLKTRGWTVDYENGLQKVFYKEKIIVNLYSYADWFSPSDIEAPTIEKVQFLEQQNYEVIDLDKINPIVFSEVMRDLDLVVSVAHVGGVDPLASHSTIEMRGVIVAETIRLMKLENIIVEKNYAEIKGVLGNYAVHLGSGLVSKVGIGNIYVLPVHSQHRGKLFLPFLDEDPKTAEIISKILLFAKDDKILDENILNQIK